MLHEEEIIIVKQALENEKKISDYKEIIEETEKEQFKEGPEEPTEEKLELEQYPAIIATIKFNFWYLLLLILPLFGWVALAYLIWDYNKKKKAEIDVIKSSLEYIKLCEAVDERNEAIRKSADSDFAERMENYRRLLAEYQEEKQTWESQKKQKLGELNQKLTEVISLATNHYLDTKLIPLKYHSVYALSYIYDIVAYSEYTFKEAAADYEIHLNRRLEEEKYHQEIEMNYLMKQLNDSLEAVHDDMQGMTHSITKGYNKLAKSQNLQTAVNGIQNHNRNKTLEKFFK